MPRYFLTRLRVEGFRGINNEGDPLDLKFNRDAVNSIFAVNANGKSSIFDALCYAFRGEIPRLAQLQAQEKPNDYYCNRFHSRGQATIEMELAPDDDGADVSIKIERSHLGHRTVISPSGHANDLSPISVPP
jgi:DNA repair exonuclease SbcCD ATPase subunit